MGKSWRLQVLSPSGGGGNLGSILRREIHGPLLSSPQLYLPNTEPWRLSPEPIDLQPIGKRPSYPT